MLPSQVATGIDARRHAGPVVSIAEACHLHSPATSHHPETDACRCFERWVRPPSRFADLCSGRFTLERRDGRSIGRARHVRVTTCRAAAAVGVSPRAGIRAPSSKRAAPNPHARPSSCCVAWRLASTTPRSVCSRPPSREQDTSRPRPRHRHRQDLRRHLRPDPGPRPRHHHHRTATGEIIHELLLLDRRTRCLSRRRVDDPARSSSLGRRPIDVRPVAA